MPVVLPPAPAVPPVPVAPPEPPVPPLPDEVLLLLVVAPPVPLLLLLVVAPPVPLLLLVVAPPAPPAPLLLLVVAPPVPVLVLVAPPVPGDGPSPPQAAARIAIVVEMRKEPGSERRRCFPSARVVVVIGFPFRGSGHDNRRARCAG